MKGVSQFLLLGALILLPVKAIHAAPPEDASYVKTSPTSNAAHAVLAANRGDHVAQRDFSEFWKRFKRAVIASDKAAVAELTKFPLAMPSGVKAVSNKENFLRRYDEIFKGEADAAQCFGKAEPRKESAQRYEVYCPFKGTPNDWENAPIGFIFELSKGGWKFTGLDNINE